MTETVRAQLLSIYADEHRDHIAALRDALAAGAQADFEDAYRHAHSLKGAARAVDMEVVTAIAHALESLVEGWWEGRGGDDAGQRRLAARALDAIEDLSAAALRGVPLPTTHPILGELQQASGETATVPPGLAGPCRAAPPPVAAASTLRVETDTLDRLAEAMATLSVEVERLGEAEQPLRQVRHLLDMALAEDARPARETLVRIRSALAQTLDEMAEREWALLSAAASLKRDMQRLRMVAAEGVLGGFGPMVRELAGEEGKQVRLEVEGMTTLADRDVLHALAEAVLHLLRNAVHHGIEPPEERLAEGKEGEGRLSLSVAAQGGRLVVEIADDGRGIDTAAVQKVAAARGLLATGDRESLQRLIFLPGFSTARAVTTGAGRGMGMAIAQGVATRLQGSLEVDSAPGRGTRVILAVPLALLAQPLLLLKARGEVFALPVSALGGVHSLSVDDLIPLEGGSAAVIDGVQVRLVDLGALLGLAGRMRTGRSACVAVINHGPVRLGVVADRFLDVREYVVMALDPPLAEDERLAGSVVLDDGRLVLVLVPAALLSLAVPGKVALVPCAAAAPRRTVLVVDDSSTTRALERGLLETQGYKVLLATNGRDALERMAEEVPWLVVSDIEMPELDGFGLLAAMRGDPRLVAVPVVVVSSRDGPADRARGRALGVVAHLSKTGFDQDEFLNIVKGLE